METAFSDFVEICSIVLFILAMACSVGAFMTLLYCVASEVWDSMSDKYWEIKRIKHLVKIQRDKGKTSDSARERKG